ncbi:hypothetical protein TIFTF001_016192 [Ficus carica]|uniref:Protein kinase domain-containing protein n=1 Tax=Ficus carica TaxID=3494 RepID=A0AA88DIS9_FICCA|nr:hypothetical protein TIFTF001_016192 [Ficus carica]
MPSPYSLLIWVIFLLFFNLKILSSSDSSSPPNNNITLSGDAFFINNSISLTQELATCLSSSSPSPYSPPFSPFLGVGQAFYANPIRFLDPSTNTTSSFSCTFTFSIVPSPLCSPGDGIAFLIAPEATDAFFSEVTGHIGLPVPAITVQDSFFAVEFDTSFDPLLGDINGNHIGIDIDTAVSITSVDVVPRGMDLKSGREITAWIEYRNAMGMIRVWAGYSSIRPPNPVLVAQIDLSNVLKEFMYVGFSASNGQGSAVHVVKKWWFKAFRRSPVSVDVVEEGDCFICSSEDSAIEIRRKNPFHGRKSKIGDMALGLGGLAAFVFSFFAIVSVMIFVCIKRRKIVDRTRGDNSLGCRLQSNRVPTRLSLAEIRAATMGFDRNRVVGEGASAIVYKGSLPFGGEVAVKRFQRGGNRAESSRNPFSNEFTTMVGCLRHKNLVQLQGWCCEGSELVLVYEYMPNGSLDKILHRTESIAVLSWKQRLKILLGVASALAYLHEECERQIIHRDKETNKSSFLFPSRAATSEAGTAVSMVSRGLGIGAVGGVGRGLFAYIGQK